MKRKNENTENRMEVSEHITKQSVSSESTENKKPSSTNFIGMAVNEDDKGKVKTEIINGTPFIYLSKDNRHLCALRNMVIYEGKNKLDVINWAKFPRWQSIIPVMIELINNEEVRKAIKKLK